MTETTTPTEASRSAMPEPVLAALSLVLDYLWDDEYRDFGACPSEERISVQLRNLRRWLNEQVPQDSPR